MKVLRGYVGIALVVAIVFTVVTSSIVYTYIQQSMSRVEGVGYIEVTDFLNRTVRIPRNISRVVAIGPGALRLVTYLNVTDLVVGVEELEHRGCVGRDYSMAYCEFFKTLPVIGSGGPRNPPNPEMLMKVKPDLIIMFSGYASLYQPDRLEREVNVPVLVIDYGVAGYVDTESLKRALSLLGKVLNKEGRAEQLVSFIDSVVEDLSKRVVGVGVRPKTYVGAISYTGAQPFTASQSRFAPLVLLNTSSIVDSLKPGGGYVQVDFEFLLKEQPEYVFVDENNLNVVLDDFMKSKDLYCSLKAFKEGRVFSVLPFNYYHTNIATALANAYFVGKVLYPEVFADVDPIQKADEVFKVFVGKALYQEFLSSGYLGFVSLSDLLKCG